MAQLAAGNLTTQLAFWMKTLTVVQNNAAIRQNLKTNYTLTGVYPQGTGAPDITPTFSRWTKDRP